MKPLKRYQTGL